MKWIMDFSSTLDLILLVDFAHMPGAEQDLFNESMVAW